MVSLGLPTEALIKSLEGHCKYDLALFEYPQRKFYKAVEFSSATISTADAAARGEQGVGVTSRGARARRHQSILRRACAR